MKPILKQLLYIGLFLFNSIVTYADVLPVTMSSDTFSEAELGNLNYSLNILNQSKLDLHPGDIIPRTDNQYVLGNLNYKWKGIFTSSLTTTNLYGLTSLSVSTITISSATITQLSVSSLTLTNLNSLIKYKVGSFTSAAADGDQSITGVGFKPRLIEFEMGYTEGGGTWNTGQGQMDYLGNQTAASMYVDGGSPATNSTITTAAGIIIGSTPQAFAVFKTMDTDGFTITWTFSNATAKSKTVLYKAYQ